jgi:hypothetical protein
VAVPRAQHGRSHPKINTCNFQVRGAITSHAPVAGLKAMPTTIRDLEASFEIIDAICLVAKLNASKGQEDITLSVENGNSCRAKISSYALARIVELAREALGDDAPTDEDDGAA